MAGALIKPISAPTIQRQNFGASTTTIRETNFTLGIRPAQAELAQILRVDLSMEQQVELSGAVTSAQDNIEGRQKWAYSTQSALTSFDQQYEDGVFWSYYEAVQLVMPAAATAAIAYTQEGGGKKSKEVMNPPIIVASEVTRLYDIAVESDALFTYSPFGVELMWQMIEVDGKALAALLARADLFL